MTSRISDLRSDGIKLPSKSTIKVSNIGMDKFEIEIPRTGFKGKHIYVSVFSIIWISFISFWTFGAAQGSIFFALFSIPFWIVGLLMIKGLIVSIFESQLIKIERDSLTISRKAPFLTKNLTISYSELSSIEMQSLLINTSSPFKLYQKMGAGVSSFNPISKIPTVTYSTTEETIWENLSNPEQKWLVNYLNEKIVPLMRFID